MSEKVVKQRMNDIKEVLSDDLYKEYFYNFKEYESEILENDCRGFYNINVTLDDGTLLEHKFIFIDKIYDELLLYPLEIPKDNMFNTEQEIVNKEYGYVKFNLSDYGTKTNELVDFDGNIRKKEKGEKTVRFHEINFLVKPSEGYDFQKYFKGEMAVHINNFSKKYQVLMNRHFFQGICEIVLVLKSGEHINLFYTLNRKKDSYVYLRAFGWEDDHIRNLNNIPSEHILYKNFKYYFYSKRIDFANEYSKHMYERYDEDELICVNTRNFSNEVLSAIKSFGNKGQLLYSFITNIDGQINKTTEIYEFVKFKKIYQWKGNYVILKTKKVPYNSWHKTELSDIKVEKWEYLIG